ncbi:AI-2E family transporter [anaerobic digester metagenome]
MAPAIPSITLPTWTFWVIVFAIIAAGAVAFWPLVGISVLAASLGVVLFPLQRRLSKRLGPIVAAVLLTIVIGVALVGAAVFTIGVLVQNLDFIIEMVRAIFSAAAAPIADPFGGTLPLDPAKVTEAVQAELGAFSNFLSSLVGELPIVGLETIVFFLVLYLTLEQGEATGKRLEAALPAHVRRPVERLWQMAVDVMYSIFVVHFATAFITFLIAIPFFWFLGYGHVLFFAVLSGVFQLVPFLGQTVILIVIGGYALAIGDLRGVLIILFIGYPFVAALPDWIMRPLLMGAQAKLHPVVMFIGFFGGITLLGLVGLILGPLLLALAVGAYAIVVDELELGRRAEEGQAILEETGVVEDPVA